MKYLFRPTPVVTLGRDRGADRVVLLGPPAGRMLGGPGATSRMPSRSLATQGSPWIVRSGTMASFGTLGGEPCRGCGGGCFSCLGRLGDDTSGDFVDTSSPDFYSGAFATPSLPVDSAGLPTDFFSGAGAAPIISPTGSVLTQSDLNALAPTELSSVTPGALAVVSAPAPPAQAGSGAGLPGTTPVNPPTSLIQSLTNLVAGKSSPYAVTPGLGVNPRAVVASPAVSAGSFLQSSSLVAGVPNATVIFGGLALLVLAGVLAGGKK